MDYILFTAGATAALIDLKLRKIPNWLTFSLAAAGLVGSFWLFGWEGALASAKGWLAGIGIFLLPFLLGGMGGGDVKMMGAIGAFNGAVFVLEAALLTALYGGLMALTLIIWKKKTATLKRLCIGFKLFALTRGQVGKDFILPPGEEDDKKERLYVPYGVAIFLGIITAYLVDFKLFG
ncbi:MAG TPA: prepilin peptidase [Desulfotomaculum sp.]|nr:MAG: hypothetical protein JL56_04295 [Desulfotomaculum sp. BICA1-6]HBX24062.1 prepilin peptidase [Desulfotomaculum sp.]